MVASPKIVLVSVPEYTLDQKFNYSVIGSKLDKAIADNFLGHEIAVRGLSISDHPNLTIDDLIKMIVQLGTDRYDAERKMSVAHDFYAEKQVDLFAVPVKDVGKIKIMEELIRDFANSGDRAYPLKLDLLSIYDLSQLLPVPIQYQDGWGEDAFRFKYPDKKNMALLGFVKIVR